MTGEQVTLRRAGIRCRPLSPLDADDISEACNDPEIQKWIPLPRPYDLDDARAFIGASTCDPRAREASMTFAIEADDAAPGRLLGCIGLHPVTAAHGVYEIGYWVAPWGRGGRVAARATRLLAEWAIRSRGAERIEVRVQPGNAASRTVPNACGFTYEGTLRSAALHRDRRIDLEVYSLLPAELS